MSIGIFYENYNRKSVTSEQFEHKNSQRPVVSTYVMTTVKDDFGRNIFRSSTESPCFPTRL